MGALKRALNFLVTVQEIGFYPLFSLEDWSFTGQTVAKKNKFCDCTQDNCVIFTIFCILNHFSVIHAKGPALWPWNESIKRHSGKHDEGTWHIWRFSAVFIELVKVKHCNFCSNYLWKGPAGRLKIIDCPPVSRLQPHQVFLDKSKVERANFPARRRKNWTNFLWYFLCSEYLSSSFMNTLTRNNILKATIIVYFKFYNFTLLTYFFF